MTYDMHKCDTLYNNDPAFHALVKALVNMIEKLELTPMEIRQAAMYAAYRVDSVRVRQLLGWAENDKRYLMKQEEEK